MQIETPQREIGPHELRDRVIRAFLMRPGAERDRAIGLSLAAAKAAGFRAAIRVKMIPLEDIRTPTGDR